MTHGNGSLAQHDYDAAGRLTALRHLKSDASVISVFTYSYDATGNRLGVQEASGDLVTWSYDETYQLTREQRSGNNAYDTTFTYDGLGNRLTQVSSGAITTYAYDAANELSTAEDNTGLTTFTYDANGNTAGEVRPNADRVTYTWDVENHLTKVELPSAVVNTITLDGDGKRRSIQDSAGLRNIIWDMENIVAELDSGNATLAQYTLAPEGYGALISQRRSGSSSFHHFDALGSTDRLTDGSANTLAAYLYRAFGIQTVLSGSSPNPFTWVGQLGYYRQSDVSDYWVRARTLNPSPGRWLTRDSFREGINWYNYVGANPLLITDPDGLQWCEGSILLRGRFIRKGKIEQEYTNVTCMGCSGESCGWWEIEESETSCLCTCNGTYYIGAMKGYFHCSSKPYYYLTKSPACYTIPGIPGKLYCHATWSQGCMGHWFLWKGTQFGGFSGCNCDCIMTVLRRYRGGRCPGG